MERRRLSFSQALGTTVRESLEIIEDAEEIDEEEADSSSINHSDDQAPMP